ncbi:hypothetical protein BGZ61DRAFT_540498 [Ilyonectria robusta]|uniref:uncharacterized protein n=1 Tax=Ilyonectria robusta TaxID=1079257 RepID=UPI001E8D4FCB|nr:uncharacterized protein BGZ61DRAFT_540498 [Ilyonectria robusta]KAH8658570.1 hypothetical protein BGZ61DRAFT_540498 [Ilyonectria robusta]
MHPKLIARSTEDLCDGLMSADTEIAVSAEGDIRIDEGERINYNWPIEECCVHKGHLINPNALKTGYLIKAIAYYQHESNHYFMFPGAPKEDPAWLESSKSCTAILPIVIAAMVT